jgi:hypothetical protein
MKLKIKFINHLKNWKEFFLTLIFFSTGMAILYFKNGSGGLFIFMIHLGINFIFTLYLTSIYYLKNRGEEYFIEPDRIIRFKNNKKEVFHSSDINKIVICKSANQDKWGIPYTTFETFRLARIYLTNGEVIILTNLLEYDIEVPLKILENVKFERRKGFSFFI